ncbi:MAG: hypothetical protein RLO50_00865 [Azospirillaceae bacterium]
MISRLFIGLAGAGLLIAGLAQASIPPAYSGAGHLFDPAIVVNNGTAAPARLAWQTEMPGLALSPARMAAVPAAARDWTAPQGFFLFGGADGGVAAENVLYLSLLDADGGVLAQLVLDDELAVDPATLESLALHVTIAADGALAAALD